jgi:hypothetical protein
MLVETYHTDTLEVTKITSFGNFNRTLVTQETIIAIVIVAML